MASLINTIQSKFGELSTGTSSSKKALLLGAGFVCKPTAQILADAGVEVTIGNLACYSRMMSTSLTTSSLPHSQVCPEALRRP